jgi:hypothetical protein
MSVCPFPRESWKDCATLDLSALTVTVGEVERLIEALDEKTRDDSTAL